MLNQDWQFTLKIITKASEQEVEDKLYYRWISENPNLQKPVNFMEYKKQLGVNVNKTEKVDKKIDQEARAERIKKFRKVVRVEKGSLHSGL